MNNAWIYRAGTVLAIAVSLTTAALADMHPAQRYRAGNEPVRPASDGTFFCEAEEFHVVKPGWQAKDWGENYYAATIANTFLSRKAFLGAPPQGETTEAEITIAVEEAGNYVVLARYEAPYRFETRFKIQIEQNGKRVFDRQYGARDNIKIWPFGRGLEKEIVWRWGAVENIVWEGWLGEGKTPYARLKPGLATIRLIAAPQPGDAAKRNVDLVMLTRDEAQVKARVENAKLRYNPLDGWLTQTGDAWMRVENTGEKPVKVATGGNRNAGWHEHSPYWVHQRNWKPVSATVPVGQTTEWIEVGSVMDTLNDGQWNFNVNGPCRIHFGVAAANGKIEVIKEVEHSGSGSFVMAGEANTRYSRRLRRAEEVLYDLDEFLNKAPKHGRAPALMPVYASVFGLDAAVDDNSKFEAARDEFIRMFGIIPRDRDSSTPGAYEDWRKLPNEKLETTCEALSKTQRANIGVMSLGDEISLPVPHGAAAGEGFAEFLKGQKVTLSDVDATAGGWGDVIYDLDEALKEANPGIYYWSRRYQHHFGIENIKLRTDILRRYLPNAGIGANFSPHHGGQEHAYLGDVFQWVDCFRQSGMTMPWSEDYVWQVPVGTPQMNGINLALFRAANRYHPERDILYYVMAHSPGNTPAMWQRLFFNALGGGMTILNLYEFVPIYSAYTENYVQSDAMYAAVLRTLRELGLYEDIVKSGRVRPASAGLWFSETADIWGSNAGANAAAKRALYIAVLHQGVALDVLTDDDAARGTLDAYKVLYLTDSHMTETAAKQIADWVSHGGHLFATAGAGMWNEYNRPNTIMRELLGIKDTGYRAPEEATIGYIKQDLPFAKALDSISMAVTGDEPAVTIPAFGAVSRITTAGEGQMLGTFSDGSPAVVGRSVGEGSILYCAFLPGLSYFQPAIPRIPVDRGSTDDAMAHFIPTAFNPVVGRLVGKPLTEVAHPTETSNALIEVSLIDSDRGLLAVLGNWSGEAIQGFRLTIQGSVPSTSARLGSGGPVAVSKDENGNMVYTFDLDISGDALVLR